MHRYFVEISYHGESYCGWQKQPNAATVQEAVEQSLFKLFGNKSIDTIGCGRTDTGVHAHRFFFHFDVEQPIKNTSHLIYKLNSVLPPDVCVHRLFEVPETLHARFSAQSRTYRYFIHFKKDPFLKDQSTFLPYRPSVERMNTAAQSLIGDKDFTSFSKLHTDVKTNRCSVYEAQWFASSDNQWYFEIRANRFLRNMVRAVVGTLLDVGRGKLNPVDINPILEEKNRNAASTSAPAKGLFLWEINYNEPLLFNLNSSGGIQSL